MYLFLCVHENESECPVKNVSLTWLSVFQICDVAGVNSFDPNNSHLNISQVCVVYLLHIRCVEALMVVITGQKSGNIRFCQPLKCAWISFCFRNWGLWMRILCRRPAIYQPHPAWFPPPLTFPAPRHSQVRCLSSIVTKKVQKDVGRKHFV